MVKHSWLYLHARNSAYDEEKAEIRYIQISAYVLLICFHTMPTRTTVMQKHYNFTIKCTLLTKVFLHVTTVDNDGIEFMKTLSISFAEKKYLSTTSRTFSLQEESPCWSCQKPQGLMTSYLSALFHPLVLPSYCSIAGLCLIPLFYELMSTHPDWTVAKIFSHKEEIHSASFGALYLTPCGANFLYVLVLVYNNIQL